MDCKDAGETLGYALGVCSWAQLISLVAFLAKDALGPVTELLGLALLVLTPIAHIGCWVGYWVKVAGYKRVLTEVESQESLRPAD
jgi:hypothetical protein